MNDKQQAACEAIGYLIAMQAVTRLGFFLLVALFMAGIVMIVRTK